MQYIKNVFLCTSNEQLENVNTIYSSIKTHLSATLKGPLWSCHLIMVVTYAQVCSGTAIQGKRTVS